MIIKMSSDCLDQFREYQLPRYKEIPNVGLYLDQVVKYLNEYLQLYPDMEITGSMVSNYVKKHLITNPVKKLYYRDQIAYLLFIAIAKTVISLEHVRIMLEVQQEHYELPAAYDFVCEEFEKALRTVFLGEDSGAVPKSEKEEIFLLRQIVATAANKVYLERSFE